MNKNKNKNKKLISVAELGKMLGISRIAVYKKIISGEIKAERVGHAYTILKESLPYILGEELDETEKRNLDLVIKKVVIEYGEVLIRLGQG